MTVALPCNSFKSTDSFLQSFCKVFFSRADFQTGSNEFLTSKLGLKSEGDYTFNTSNVEKGNGRHVFGSDLCEEELLLLIEYLKSL
jgi:hypothetical protein